MAKLTNKLRSTENGFIHWCLGCKELHEYHVHKLRSNGARWSFNNNLDSPSFQPSMNIKIGPWPKDNPNDPDDISICHYYITDGNIQYLTDCTHEYKGQTITLPDIPNKIHNKQEIYCKMSKVDQ